MEWFINQFIAKLLNLNFIFIQLKKYFRYYKIWYNKGRVWELEFLAGLGKYKLWKTKQGSKKILPVFSVFGFGSSSMAVTVEVKEVGCDRKKKRKRLQSKTMPFDQKVEVVHDSIGSSRAVDVQEPGSEKGRVRNERRFLDDEVGV